MQFRSMILLVLTSMPLLAQACSPVLMSPEDALQAPGPTARFARIVLAEVIAARAPARISELERWRKEMHEDAAAQKLEEVRYARDQIDAAAQWKPGDPPLPPPPSPMPGAVLPVAVELRTELDLFVLETLYGAHQDRLTVPAGGPCGSEPRLGQEVLVFMYANGAAHVLSRAGGGGAQNFDAKFLEQARACARGACEHVGR